ncbi:MAG: aminotransferase class V-fold PLP-dependent enzyme [Halioglobus sp.]
MTTTIEKIRSSVIGANRAITTSFGVKPLVYADYTASGRALGFIEDAINEQVLPYYANTHTETSLTGARTTALREQAREVIRASVNGTAADKVIFCGSGATAAINKLIDILNLRLPADLSDRYELDAKIPTAARPVVFIGPYEHHSNELPWRESIAEVVSIPLNKNGQIDTAILQAQLKRFANRELLIGSFSAASNVTGIKSDVPAITALLKQFGAQAFWDYAAAGPYVGIDVNGEAPIDAVFLSPHKFVGGPGTPGVLVVKETLLGNRVPAVVGGGTVAYVTPEDHIFLADAERREEGGTPAIVESIRAGMVFAVQQSVGTDVIEAREHALIDRALKRLQAFPNIEVLGSVEAPRLSIVSMRFKHGERDLHYGFVVSLLNDLYGIQVRGGCSCAGPYGHSLLNMDMRHSKALEAQIRTGSTLLRPGWVRLNFNYFISEGEFEYLLEALETIAEHGWRLLPLYQYDEASGVWRYQSAQAPSQVSLLDCLAGNPDAAMVSTLADSEYPDIADAAKTELLLTRSIGTVKDPKLGADAEALRWFVLPSEVRDELEMPRATVA